MELRQHFTITAIIAVAAGVFVCQQASDDKLYRKFSTIPAHVVAAWESTIDGGPTLEVARTFGTLITATLMHGDVEHIVLNMVFLWVFGSLASRHLGPWWALAVFVLTGIGGSVAHVLLNRESMIPMIGASGAVCGFEGLYLGIALQWRLDWPDVWPIAHPIPPLQLAALAVLGFVFDLYGLASDGHGVAYGAHIGGLLVGLLIAGTVTSVWPTEDAFRRRTRGRQG